MRIAGYLCLMSPLVVVLICPPSAYAQPSWFKNTEHDYPRSRYLLGLGIGAGKSKGERMLVAEENARSDLIKSIRTHISSEFIQETVETSQRLDQYARSRVASTASLEVDGIQIVQREHRGNTAYAFAVLPKLEARRRHAQKITGLSVEMSQLLEDARGHEEALQTEEALKAYLRLYPLLGRREETQAILLALGDFSPAAFQELDGLEGQTVITRTEVDGAIERLTAGNFGSVEDAAAALAFRLRQQLPPGERVLVLPFTYGETRFSSRFSRYLAQVVGHKLADTGLQGVRVPSNFQPRSMDHRREQARQAGASVVISGPYLKKAEAVVVFAHASAVGTGTRIAAADVEMALALVEQEQLDFLPQNFQRALQDAGIFGMHELIEGDLQVEAWTDRGAENVILEEGEEVTLAVRVNQPCYLQVIYHLADGKRALLFQSYYVNEAMVNHAVVLPDTFVVAAPFGVEVLQVFASTEELPDVRLRRWKGYDVLEEDLEEYVTRTRGLRRKETTVREMAEVRVTITTMEEP